MPWSLRGGSPSRCIREYLSPAQHRLRSLCGAHRSKGLRSARGRWPCRSRHRWSPALTGMRLQDHCRGMPGGYLRRDLILYGSQEVLPPVLSSGQHRTIGSCRHFRRLRREGPHRSSLLSPEPRLSAVHHMYQWRSRPWGPPHSWNYGHISGRLYLKLSLLLSRFPDRSRHRRSLQFYIPCLFPPYPAWKFTKCCRHFHIFRVFYFSYLYRTNSFSVRLSLCNHTLIFLNFQQIGEITGIYVFYYLYESQLYFSGVHSHCFSSW